MDGCGDGEAGGEGVGCVSPFFVFAFLLFFFFSPCSLLHLCFLCSLLFPLGFVLGGYQD